MLRKFALLFALVLVLISCTARPTPSVPGSATTTTKIRLPMGYIPNVQFAPFYVAVDKGYFAEQNIEIDFDYSFDLNGAALVGADQLPFTVLSGDQLLLARSQGLPIKYIFATYQKFPISIVSMESQNIHNPTDLRDKKIGLPSLLGPTNIGLQALLFSAGLTSKDVTVDTIGFTQVETLTSGNDQAVVVYSNNEPIQLRAQGDKISELRVSDYEHLAGDGIATNQKTIDENPELVRGFTTALAKGIEYTIAHPDDAYTICLKYVANLAQADKSVQLQVLNTSIDFWRADRIGYSDMQAWANMNNLLVKMGLLSTPQNVNAAVTNDFVP